jgi:hypothetical protein
LTHQRQLSRSKLLIRPWLVIISFKSRLARKKCIQAGLASWTAGK